VAASSVTRVTAVGNTTTAGKTRALIETWDGSKWSTVAHPNPSATLNTLNAIDYNPGNSQAWSVGDFANSVGVATTLVEHLNASGWHLVDSQGVDNEGTTSTPPPRPARRMCSPEGSPSPAGWSGAR
jgi:hypothetical protein